MLRRGHYSLLLGGNALNQSSKCAIGGIVAALSLVILISVAIIPFLTYALPAAAGILIIPIVIEIDKKWAFGVYATVAILGALLVPNKEVAAMYIAFFGYYPIIKAIFEGHFKNWIAWILKTVSFIVSIGASYYVLIALMGLEIDEIETYGLIAVPMLLGAGTIAFIIYDIALTKIIELYLAKWRKIFKRYFK